jgi:hypothetical protein
MKLPEGRFSRRGPVLAVLLLLPFVFLFARLPPPEHNPECLRPVTIAHWAHFVHVCDSYAFTEAMMDLPHYFTAPNYFRARPLYILGSEGVAAVLRPAALLVRSAIVEGRVAGDFHIDLFLPRFAEYFALMIVNFLALGTALWMALRLIAPRDGALAAALGAAIATSDLVHGLFWTQHSNFLNLVVPLGGITYFLAGCRAREMRRGTVAALGLATGLVILAYAYMVIWLSAFVFGALYRDWRMAASPGETARGLFRVLILLVPTGCGPVLIWWAINRFYLHQSISSEADVFRQFVWLADAWQEGRLGAALAEHWHGYLPQAWGWLGWPAPVALAGIALFAWLGRRRWPPMQALGDPIIVGAALTIVGMLAFNFLQGYYQPRLLNGIVLVLFVALARAAQKAGRARLGALVLSALALGQVVLAFFQPPISLT